MSVYYIKQPSSRPILTSTSTANAIKAGPQTFQLRVTTTSAGNLSIGDSSTVVNLTVPIAANVAGEYIGVQNGQWYSLAASMTVVEMS
jgi:hypothetical protein